MLVLFGGAGAVLVATSGFVSKFISDRSIEKYKNEMNYELEKLKSDLSRDQENYKLNLKRSEILFDRELESAREFLIMTGYFYNSNPMSSKYDYIQSEIKTKLELISEKTNSFYKKHAPILSDIVRDRVCRVIVYSREGSLVENVSTEDAEGRRAHFSNLVADDLKEIEDRLLAEIRGKIV